MEFQIVSGTILDAEVDFLAIPVFGDPAKDSLASAADDWLEGTLAEVATAEDFRGKSGQVVVVPSRELLPARFVALIGMGEKKGFHPSQTRHARGQMVK